MCVCLQDGLTFKGTHQFLVHAVDGNIFVGSVHTKKKNTGALVLATKETGVEVNANKTKYMVMSCLEIRMQEEVTI